MAEIHIQLKLAGDGFPTMDELEIRHELEDRLAEAALGEITDVGAGMGVMDIYIEVEDAQAASEAVWHMVLEMGVDNIATVNAVGHTPEA